LNEFILGYWGVVLMTALWSTAVGFVWLPVWRTKDIRLAAPGVLVAISLLVFAPFMIPMFCIAFVGTSMVVGPIVGLVPRDARANFALAVLCLLLAGASLSVVRSETQPASAWQVVIEIIALPLGIVFLGTAVSSGRKLFAPAAASALFAAAWLVWMARDHYYRLSP
jgi:hypothetical protein